MAAFNDLNGVPCTVNKHTLKEILKERYGFNGFVVSDANAIRECITHGIAEDELDAGRQAINAGLDVDMGTNIYINNLKGALEKGLVKEETIKSDNKEQEEKEEKEEKDDNKRIKISEDKREKIVIRDPKHSEYRFITNLVKAIVFIIKLFAIFIALCFAGTFVFLLISFVLSFMFTGTGLVFVGTLLSIIGCLLINFIIIVKLYNFITVRKNLSLKLPVLFIVELLIGGSGVGLILTGVTNFDIVNPIDSDSLKTTEYTFNMTDSLRIDDSWGEINYIVGNNNDIKVICNHSSFYTIEAETADNFIYFYPSHEENNEFKIIRQVIKDVNNKKIINYSEYSIDIYTTEANINKIKNNIKVYNEREYESEVEEEELQQTINEQNIKIENYENKLDEYENRINELEQRLNEYENN